MKKLTVAALLTAVAIAVTVPLARAQPGGYGPGMMGSYGWGQGGAFGMIWMLLWWVLIILGIVLLAKWLFRRPQGGGGHAPGNRALEILRERYARGEIDKKEFEERKRDLGA
ncbi:MAG TPA: SHOCT domain-containing protein [Casimicrobiaceae bacterium]|nr:SHOCT domain-containing protein [Casimicrobiaceae bacterium]